MRAVRSEARQIELLARQLCVWAGQDPNRNIRVGDVSTVEQEGCLVLRQTFMPAWKLRIREATRMSRAGWRVDAPDEQDQVPLAPDAPACRRWMDMLLLIPWMATFEANVDPLLKTLSMRLPRLFLNDTSYIPHLPNTPGDVGMRKVSGE
jgi:hypothetical protein